MKANYFLGLTLANLGGISEAFAVLRCAMDIAKRNGVIFWLSRMPNAFGWIHREMQDFEGAEAFDREGAAIGHEAGFGEAEVNSVINLAMDHLHANDQAKVKTAASLLSHDAWFRWRFEIRFLHARAEQSPARTDAIALLEKATHYGAHKYIVIARTLLSRVAVRSADLEKAIEEAAAACSMLRRYPALLCAWRARAMLGRIEMQCCNPDAGIAAYRLAVSNIQLCRRSHCDPRRTPRRGRTDALNRSAWKSNSAWTGQEACPTGRLLGRNQVSTQGSSKVSCVITGEL